MKRIGIVGGEGVLLSREYHNAVRACAAQPVTLTPTSYKELLPTLDGVVIPGGSDINPVRYGQENVAAEDVNDANDSYELEVIDQTLRQGLPLFGICRGMQLLVVFLGGSLQQDINREIHTGTPHGDRIHGTSIKAHSFLSSIYPQMVRVNSAHHQAIRDLGDGCVPVQWSDDNVIEAVQHKRLPVIGTQWHPERMRGGYARPDMGDGTRVFQYFIKDLCSA
ncbi:gamma-glutamyl-gamma-aminobutyrate hydrolase family protein [Cutibacterium sp.]|uniref:gamma-glutamyl-gamma-aminobutyrate hydrolase family protein n=1 Tax=Cutibacterium sp. TaxID=1912221 RepID=UPI0026DBC6C0|nr:gamma-glutamyl-gamma-aminobutyrate hydrolase family protein [Cutibacterium sp.]MDO4411490.1 gamma-glutamyl-gamma-aminobutyrate hydrolase family protein [Cutibacterium sp.]